MSKIYCYIGFILANLICIFLIGCKPVSKHSSLEEISNEGRIPSEMKKKITTEYLNNIIKQVLEPQFASINEIQHDTNLEKKAQTIKIEKDRFDEFYYATLVLNGVVYGTMHPSNTKRYRFSIIGRITEKNINNPFEDLRHSLVIFDENKEYVYYKGEDVAEANKNQKEFEKKMQEEIRKDEDVKREEEKKKEAGRNFSIDGIKVYFAFQEGTSYIYKTSKELMPEQIVRAINKIGDYNNVIQFYVDDTHYADYVYNTKCIIFKSTGVIYKVKNGHIVKAN